MTLSKFLNPKTDTAFKKIFGSRKYQNISIRFINDILGFTGDDQIKEVEFLSPIQDPEIASKKQSIVDVLCRDNRGVTHIIEMQVADTLGFEKRAQYYAAKAYSRQLNKGDSKYQNLKEVIFIAIADCVLFPNKEEYLSRHVILDENSYEQDLKDFSFTFVELPKFKKKKGDRLETTIEQWCRFFKYADETTEEEVERIIGRDEVIKEAYEAINQFNWSEQELLAYEEDLKRTRDAIAIMDAAIEKAEKVGETRERDQGKEEEKLAIARNLLRTGLLVQVIADATGLTNEEIEKLK